MMLTLPSLAKIPTVLQATAANPNAARMALELLPRRAKLPAIESGKFEQRALEAILRERLEATLGALEVFDIRIGFHTTVEFEYFENLDTKAPAEKCGMVMISNRSGYHLDTVWTLEERWKSIERRAPAPRARRSRNSPKRSVKSLPRKTACGPSSAWPPCCRPPSAIHSR